MKRWLVLGLGASAGGYANIEHYFNSTDPRGGTQPVVFIAATVRNGGSGAIPTSRLSRGTMTGAKRPRPVTPRIFTTIPVSNRARPPDPPADARPERL